MNKKEIICGRLFCAIFFFGFLILSLVSQATFSPGESRVIVQSSGEENAVVTEAECSAFNASYVPHKYYDNNETLYKLRIKKNEKYIPNSGPRSYFILESYSAPSKGQLIQFKSEYYCTSGARTRCYLQLSDRQSDRLYVQALDQNFAPVYTFNTKAPFALIIPNAEAGFSSIDWASVKEDNVEFFANEKNFRLGIPSVWVFDECTVGKD